MLDSVDEAGYLDGLSTDVQTQSITVEQALYYKLANFLDKRKASGDARPCGPHDMVPIYSTIFGVTKEELRDERFLGRLRRSGVGDSSVRTVIEAAANETHKGSSRESKGKGKK